MIVLNTLHATKEKVTPVYVSKCNWKQEKQVIIGMIPNGEVWHYVLQ